MPLFKTTTRIKFQTWFSVYGRTLTVITIYLCLLILIVMGMLSFAKIDNQQKDNFELAKKIESLQEQNRILSEQNKKLNEDTIYLADRNIYYSKCGLKLFALWTRTRQEITIDDVSKCEVSFGDKTKQQSFNPTENSTRNTAPRFPRKPNPQSRPNTSPPPKPEEPEPAPPVAQRCTIELLGIKLLC